MYQSYSTCILDVLTHRIIQQSDKDVPPKDDHLLVATLQELVGGSIQ
jgi:hypothetical protein